MDGVINVKFWDALSPDRLAKYNETNTAKVVAAARIAERHPGSRVPGIITGHIGYSLAQSTAWSYSRCGDIAKFRLFCDKYVDFEARNLYAFFGEHQNPDQLLLTLEAIRGRDIPEYKISEVMRILNREAIDVLYGLGYWTSIAEFCESLSNHDMGSWFDDGIRDFLLDRGVILTDNIIRNYDVALDLSTRFHVQFHDNEELVSYIVNDLSDETLLQAAADNALDDDDEEKLLEMLAYKVCSDMSDITCKKILVFYDTGFAPGKMINIIVTRLCDTGGMYEDEVRSLFEQLAEMSNPSQRLILDVEDWMNQNTIGEIPVVEWVNNFFQ